MTKSTLLTVAAILNGMTSTDPEFIEARDAINAEVAKGEAKKQANRDLYASAEAIVLAVLSDTPQTATEIYNACAPDLPASFSKSKVQYGLNNAWADKVVKHDNGKNPFTYTAL